MEENFRNHSIREVINLDGFWDFSYLSDANPDSVEIEGIRFLDLMPVPGCFDATPKYAGKRGLAAYRKNISNMTASTYRLVFDSIHHWCRVYVNKALVGEHAGGFTRFHFDFEASGDIEILVLVDNRLDCERAPLHLAYYDWYHYGGISRSVELHCLDDVVWINRVEILTKSLQPPRILVRVFFGGNKVGMISSLILDVDGKKILQDDVPLTDYEGILENEIILPEAELWSLENPNLHTLMVRLGKDNISERFGIRQISISGQEICINGQPVRLLGVNRHEAHPQFGHALPESVMISDIQQILDLGCNFIRGSHYPLELRFLDLCDEFGICVWVEAISWQQTAEHLNDPYIMDAELRHIDEMIEMSINHPSVILWGALNEGDSHDPDCQKGYERILSHIKRCDPSRPLTYASHKVLSGDLCLDLVDIVGVNCYPGWYQGEIENIPAYLDAIITHLDAVGQGEKPIIISEIGAGAVYGWRDGNAARWTEQYQAMLLDAVIRHLLIDHDRVAGLAIWQFCDIRSSELVGKILGRPRGFNNKGLVDEYRRPKLAYEVVKKLYHSIES